MIFVGEVGWRVFTSLWLQLQVTFYVIVYVVGLQSDFGLCFFFVFCFCFVLFFGLSVVPMCNFFLMTLGSLAGVPGWMGALRRTMVWGGRGVIN